MTTVEQIEAAIIQLPPDELRRIVRWIRELDWQLWDEEIERDAAGGRLDALAAEAIADYEAGHTREI